MPTNASGKEFGDFTEDVLKGANSIKEVLQSIIQTAGETDTAHNKLADTQKKTGGVAKDYADALKKAEDAIGNFGNKVGGLETNAKNVGTNLGSAKTEAAGIATEIGNIAGALNNIPGAGKAVTDALADIRSDAEKTKTAMQDIRAECDTKCLDDAMTKVKNIADKINAIGAYKIAIECDTECLNTDVIEEFEKRVGEGVKVKVGIDAEDINKAQVDIDVSTIEKKLKSIKVLFDETGQKVGGLGEQEIDVKFAKLEVLKDYISSLSDAEKETLTVTDAVARLSAGTDAFSKRFQNAEKVVSRNLGLKRLGKELVDRQKELKGFINRVEEGRQKASKPYFLKANVELGQLENLQQILEKINDPLIEDKIATMELADAMEYLRKNVPGVADSLDDAAAAAEQVAISSRTLSGEIKKQGNALDLLIDKYNEGNKEAQNFAGGIGMSGGRMIGAGVAAVFLFKKLGELVNQFKDAAVNLADFNIETAAAEKGIAGIQYGGQLADLRDDVKLTRDQYGAFIETLRDGANSGVVSINQVVSAAQQLQEAFGGDQTARLQQYVDLLKEIPSLEEDLSITASVDDQTAALFALAEQGKISTVLELQTAGLLGGFEVEQQADADLKNAAQRTEVTVERIQDTLLDYFPAWGPQFGAIANGVFTVAGVLGGVVAGLGALKVFSGAQIAAQNVTTQAVLNTAGGGDGVEIPERFSKQLKGVAKDFKDAFKKGFSRGGGGLGGIKRGLSGAVRSTAFGAGSGPVATASKELAKQLIKIGPYASQAAKGLSLVALPLTALGIAAKLAGNALSNVQDDVAQGTDDVSASAARLTGEYLKAVGTVASFAAVGATIGSLVPVIGTAIGAASGAIVGAGVVVATSTGNIGNALQDFGGDLQATGKDLNGVEFNKYNGFVRFAGKAVQNFGEVLQDADAYAREWGSKILGGAKQAGIWALKYGTGIGQIVTASTAAAKGLMALAKTAEQRQAEADAADAQAETAESLSELKEESDKVSKALKERQKVIGDSALAFQRQIAAIEAAANSGALKLVRLNRELEGARLDIFSEAGASAGTFNRSISGLSSSVTGEFGKITNALEKRRQAILNDTKLQGPLREQALNKLSEQELEAAQRLVEGIDSVVDSLLKAPEIVNAGLRNSIQDLRRQIETEGTIGVGDIGETFKNDLEAPLDLLGGSLTRGAQAFDEAAKLEEQLAARRAAAEQSLIKSIGDAASEISGIEIEAVVDKATGEVVKDEAGEPVKKLNVDLDKLGEAAADVDAAVKNAKTAIDETSEALSGVVAVKAAENLSATKESLAALDEELAKAEEVLSKAKEAAAGADEEDIAEKEAAAASAEKKVAKLKEERKQAVAQQTQLAEAIKGEIAKATANIEDSAKQQQAQELLFKSLVEGYKGSASEEALIKQALEGLTDGSKEQQELIKQWATQLQALNKNIDQKAAIDALLNTTNGQNAVLAQQEKAYQEVVSGASAVLDRIRNQADIVSKEAAEQDRLLRLRESGINLAKLNGDAVGAVLDVQASENRLFEEQLKSSQEQLRVIEASKGELEKQKKAQEEQLTAAREAVADADAAGKSTKALSEKVKFLELGLTVIDKAANEAEESAIAAREKASSAAAALIDVAGRIDQALDAFGESQFGLQLAAELDFGDALSEATKFADDLTSATAKAYDITTKAAEADAAARIAAIKRQSAQERASILRQQASGAITDETASARLRTNEAATQARIAREETRQKERVLEAGRREAAIKNEALDVESDLIDSQLEFLSATGGNLDAFIDLQNQGLAIERAKLKVAEDELAKAKQRGATGLELRKLEAAVIKQSIKVQTKEFGKQRDIFENLVGQAFGSIRENVGARERNLDILRAGGIAESRVLLRSGLTASAGPGGPQTLAQREAARRASGTADINDLIGGDGPIGRAPEKKVEEQIFKEAQENRAANVDTAAAVGDLQERGSKKGSIFTHDDGLHQRMDKLINIMASCCTTLGNIEQAGAGTEGNAERVQKAIEAAGIEETSAMKEFIRAIGRDVAKALGIYEDEGEQTRLTVERIGKQELAATEALKTQAMTTNRKLSEDKPEDKPEIKAGKAQAEVAAKTKEEVESAQQLTKARIDNAEEEKKGREREQKEGQLTEQKKRTAIATGRAVVEAKTEEAGIATPRAMSLDEVSGAANQPRAASRRNVFSTTRITPQQRREAAQMGVTRAVSMSLAGNARARGAAEAASGGFGGGAALKAPGGAMSGDSFSGFGGQSARQIRDAAMGITRAAPGANAFAGFGGQTAKQIRDAAMARRGGGGGLRRTDTVDGRPVTASAIMGTLESQGGLTGRKDEFGRMETRQMAAGRMMEEAAAEKMAGMTSKGFTTGSGGGMKEIFETKYGTMEVATPASKALTEKLTTTGGESLTMAESTSVTAAESKAGEQAVTPPGIQAKAEPNDNAVQDDTTVLNQAEAISQRNGSSFEQNKAFQASSEIGKLGNAGGSKKAEIPIMKVEGTMKVQFDGGIFKNTIATVVGEVINSPEIVKALTDRGFINKSQ
jgi:hypothetical protein